MKTTITTFRPALMLTCLIFFALNLSACDGRVMAVGHILSLVLTCGMVWATLNMDKVR